jgi:hypothetical protein
MSFTAALRGRTEEEEQPRAHQVAVAGPATIGSLRLYPQHEQQTTNQSVRATNVNSLPLDKMLKVAGTVVQQIITEFNGAVLEVLK